MRRDALEDLVLLRARQPARHATPQDPPLELARVVLVVDDPGVEQPPGLLDAPVVERIAEPGTQRVADEVVPARLVRRRLAAAAAQILERLPQRAQDRERPAVARPEDGLQLAHHARRVCDDGPILSI